MDDGEREILRTVLTNFSARFVRVVRSGLDDDALLGDGTSTRWRT